MVTVGMKPCLRQVLVGETPPNASAGQGIFSGILKMGVPALIGFDVDLGVTRTSR